MKEEDEVSDGKGRSIEQRVVRKTGQYLEGNGAISVCISKLPCGVSFASLHGVVLTPALQGFHLLHGDRLSAFNGA
jgi:hypothetical protein